MHPFGIRVDCNKFLDQGARKQQIYRQLGSLTRTSWTHGFSHLEPAWGSAPIHAAGLDSVNHAVHGHSAPAQ